MLVSGGYNPLNFQEVFDSVDRYDISEDTWKGQVSQLNTARYYHSSCAIADYIYVFYGFAALQKPQIGKKAVILDSIERINVQQLLNFEEVNQSIEEEEKEEKENKEDKNKENEIILWENIQSATACKIRIDALLAPINSNEILVLGGSDGN